MTYSFVEEVLPIPKRMRHAVLPRQCKNTLIENTANPGLSSSRRADES